LLKAVPWRGGGLKITGTLKAEVDQVSVISLETFTSALEYSVERYFMLPRGANPADDDDVDIIEHGIVDLGEILAETMALELDPYPRQEGEVFSIENPWSRKSVTLPALSKLKPSTKEPNLTEKMSCFRDCLYFTIRGILHLPNNSIMRL
jgi:hypothetical protein